MNDVIATQQTSRDTDHFCTTENQLHMSINQTRDGQKQKEGNNG